MVSNKTFTFWTDAKHAAKKYSLDFGHAWIMGTDGNFRVAVGELAEEAPPEYLQEYKEGQEQ